jgi:hypothetical protein
MAAIDGGLDRLGVERDSIPDRTEAANIDDDRGRRRGSDERGQEKKGEEQAVDYGGQG